MSKHPIDFLLVEDDHEEAELTIRSLKKNNLINNIIHIDDGAEALDYIFSKGKYADGLKYNKPKMILLDLNLPKIGGLEILRRVKENDTTCMIPIVVLTSSKEERDIIESYKLRVNSYIVKPVNFESFCKAIEELKMYWMVLNQGPPYED